MLHHDWSISPCLSVLPHMIYQIFWESQRVSMILGVKTNVSVWQWNTCFGWQPLTVNSHHSRKSMFLKAQIRFLQNMDVPYVVFPRSSLLVFSVRKSKCFFHGWNPALVPRRSPWVLLVACYGSCRKVRGLGGENHGKITCERRFTRKIISNLNWEFYSKVCLDTPPDPAGGLQRSYISS